MTHNSEPKKYLSLNDVRIFRNKKTGAFEITGKSSELENGFLMNVPHESKMEEKLRKAFGIEPPTAQKPPKEFFISYSEALKDFDLISLDRHRFENPGKRIAGSKADAQGKVISITSPLPGAGKTTVASILARFLSSAKKKDGTGESLKVCIIEAGCTDNGYAKKIFPFGKNSNTLDLVLDEAVNDASVARHLTYSDSLDAHILLGVMQRDHQRHADASFYRKVLEVLKGMFDVIIFDIPERNPVEEGNYWDVISENKFWDFIFEVSEKVLLTTDMTPASVYGIKNWLKTSGQLVEKGGYDITSSKMELIINKYSTDSQTKIEDVLRMSGEMNILAQINLDSQLNDANSSVIFSNLLSGDKGNEELVSLAGSLLDGIGLADFAIKNDHAEGKPNKFYFNGLRLVKNFPNQVTLGCNDFWEFSALNLKEADTPNIMLTGKNFNGVQYALDNIRLVASLPESNCDLITYRLKGEDGRGTYPETTIEGNLELLVFLRKINLDMVQGVEYSKTKIIILEDMDEIVYANHPDLSRVDKAVRAEILELLQSLTEYNDSNLLNFIFVSSKPSLNYNSFFMNCGTYIHCGVKNEDRKVKEFLSHNIQDYPFDFFDDVPGKAFIRTPQSVSQSQIFKLVSFKGTEF